jgi:hypothetical protein
MGQISDSSKEIRRCCDSRTAAPHVQLLDAVEVREGAGCNARLVAIVHYKEVDAAKIHKGSVRDTCAT